MQRRLPSAFLACCTLVLVSGCGSSGNSTHSTTSSSRGPAGSLSLDATPKFAAPSPTAPVQSGLVQIAYRNIAIDPDTVRVKLGSTIRWTNYDSTKANVTSEGGSQAFASTNFGEGGTFEIKAGKPGVIHYECTLYPATMNGTIEVLR